MAKSIPRWLPRIPGPTRRQLLSSAGAGLAASGASVRIEAAPEDEKPVHRGLDLSLYEPHSMLRVAETKVDRAQFAAIDVHSHISRAAQEVKGVAMSEQVKLLVDPADILPLLDRKNVRSLVNLTGGYGSGLASAVTHFDRAEPGRFYCFTEPMYSRSKEPSYPRDQADAIADAHRAGAKGLKILKTLGLYLRDNITSGQLLSVDDRRFDPMWDACGQLDMPVAIHVSDPLAFFTPTDRFNERFEELNRHPDWSFAGAGYPSNAEILAARNNVIARHPGTQFLVLHVGNFAEDLANVAENLDRFPNMTVEIGARISELGRQPRAARKFFEKYQDRILFGTDIVFSPKPADLARFEGLYETYFRFLETEDEYFPYAPGPVPPQGRWRIYGLDLPSDILRKVYNGNASRVLHIRV
jgi:predicted TIM-barrel fold metal-dependent hydrolase